MLVELPMGYLLVEFCRVESMGCLGWVVDKRAVGEDGDEDVGDPNMVLV